MRNKNMYKTKTFRSSVTKLYSFVNFTDKAMNDST